MSHKRVGIEMAVQRGHDSRTDAVLGLTATATAS
jgi:hypothetical protein